MTLNKRQDISQNEAMQIYMSRNRCMDMNKIIDAMVYFAGIGDTGKAENLEFRLDRMKDMVDDPGEPLSAAEAAAQDGE